MAKKIKGITVEIGGETTGLTKALAQADKALVTTQRELNEVQKGLKLDPSNAVLVAQKHELLQNAIEQTSSKLKALEDNQERANRAFAANGDWEKQYAPLKAQIDAARTSLTELKKKQEEAKAAFEAGRISSEDYEKVKSDVKAAEQALADLRQQKKDLEAQFENGHITAEEYREYQREVENTRSRLQDLQTELRNTGTVSEEQRRKITEFGEHAKETFKGVVKAAAAITAALLAVGKQAVETGAEFDSSMSEVAATLGYTWEELIDDGSDAAETMQVLRDFALDLGKSTAFSAKEASEGLQYMALAGMDAAASMEMLPKVLDLASASGMELGKSSDMVTDAMSALGLSADGTTVMIDQMAKTASRSNTSVEQLGEAILTIGATAKTIKGGTAELTETLGLLADNGIKGAEGGTKLRNIILSLQSPTSKAAAELEKLGVSAFDSNGNFRSLQDTFADLDAALSDMSEQDAALAKSAIFSKRDLAAVNALLGTSADRWNTLRGEIEDSAGAAHEMAETKLDNLAGDVTLFKSALEGAEITISDKLTPSLRNAVQFGTEAVTKLADGFGEGGLSGAVAAAHKLIEEKLGEEARIIFGIETATEAAAAAFVTYKAAMLLTEGITALKTVNTLLAEGKTLTEALNATAAVNPYVLVATAAIGAAAAVGKLINIQTDLIDEAADSYDLLDDRQKKTVDSVRGLAKTVGDSRRKWQENRDALEKQAYTAKGLADELYRLDEAENLSNADKEKMKAIVTELNRSIEGLNIELDEQTGHLITQKSSIDALIASYERQAKAAAAQERLTELYKEQFDAEKNLQEAQEERAEGQRHLSDLQTQYNAQVFELKQLEEEASKGWATDESVKRISVLQENIAGLNQEIKNQENTMATLDAACVSASQTSKSVSGGIEEMTGILVENGATVQNAAGGMGDAFDDLADTAEKAGSEIVRAFDVEAEVEAAVDKIEAKIKEYDDKLAARTGTLQSWYDINATVSPEEASFSTFSSALDQQISDMKTWSEGIKQLEDEGINKNFLDQLKDAGPASQNYVKALLDVPAKDRNEYAAKWNKAYSGAAKIAEKQLKAMRETTETEIQGILDDAEARGADFETIFYNLGIDASAGYINALRDHYDEVKAAGKAMAEAAADGTQEGQDSNSPSKVTYKLGKDYGKGYTLGINDEVSDAVSAAKQMVDSAVRATNGAISSAELIPISADMAAPKNAVNALGAVRAGTPSAGAYTSGTDTAKAVKDAVKELVSGNTVINMVMDGDRFARLLTPKIDLLQGEKTIEISGGFAGV